MSLFTLSTGEEAETSNEYLVAGGQPFVPDDTKLRMIITNVTIEPESKYYNEHIIVDLMCSEKGKYKGFTFNHKLHVNDKKTKKADDSIKLLVSYDTNCKGGIKKTIDAGKDAMEVGLLNRALNGCDVVVNVKFYEIPQTDDDDNPVLDDNGDQRINRGNYYNGVFNKTTETTLEEDVRINGMAQNQPNTPTAPSPVEGELLEEDDIPF